ncbi:UDP-glucose/GDP-mannose dehydrogenase family protein [Kineosporia sp. J2-2]|uniref:UDP-glucose 6-dehydrogenase n=1 Tax=Kineosporia corallincola TaxID=2835133 RepID=A0ABS5TLX8_9ACTN|nr:2-dehydropantoate 2-reductase N-terminal domain-containing protein [Kineosporia corallincola]MBT0772107.1 UDP-glucose/GDP-mannose dehydrogenase family protein [Kineosporia corallincola]
MSRIFIVGSGTVGAATGRALGHAGHRVTFVDIDPRRVAVLVNEGLDARRELDLAGEPEAFIFLCTPTRLVEGRHHLADVAAGAELIGRALARADCPHIVVVRSTVPPGTTRDLVRPLVELHSGRREGDGFGIAASPHFDSRGSRGSAARAGRHAVETVRLPLTVIGSDDERITLAVRDLLTALVPPGGQLRLLGDPAEAEMVKCAHSLFNATKISFWNELWRVCDRLGLDPDEVAGAVATSAEGSLNPEYGIWGGAPYGGNQLPSDTRGFLSFAEEIGLPMPLLGAVVGVNSGFEQRLEAEMEALSMLAAGPHYYAPENDDEAEDSEDEEPYDAAPEEAGSSSSIIDENPPPTHETEPTDRTERAGRVGGEVRTDPPSTHPSRRRAQRRTWIPRQLGR